MLEIIYHVIGNLIVDGLKSLYPQNDKEENLPRYSIDEWDNAKSLIKLLDMHSGSFEEISEECQGDLSAARRNGDRFLEVSALVNLGIAYKRNLKVEQAGKYYQIAMDIVRHEGNKELESEMNYFISELNYEVEINKLIEKTY